MRPNEIVLKRELDKAWKKALDEANCSVEWPSKHNAVGKVIGVSHRAALWSKPKPMVRNLLLFPGYPFR